MASWPPAGVARARAAPARAARAHAAPSGAAPAGAALAFAASVDTGCSSRDHGVSRRSLKVQPPTVRVRLEGKSGD